MPRPRVTFSRNGITSSGPSGPPNETSKKASYAGMRPSNQQGGRGGLGGNGFPPKGVWGGVPPEGGAGVWGVVPPKGGLGGWVPPGAGGLGESSPETVEPDIVMIMGQCGR